MITAYSQRPDTVYLDSTAIKLLPGKPGAAYYSIAKKEGTIRGIPARKEFINFISGEKYLEIFYVFVQTDRNQHWRVGETRTWYKNGQLKKETINNAKNIKVSDWFENGQLYYTYKS